MKTTQLIESIKDVVSSVTDHPETEFPKLHGAAYALAALLELELRKTAALAPAADEIADLQEALAIYFYPSLRDEGNPEIDESDISATLDVINAKIRKLSS